MSITAKIVTARIRESADIVSIVGGYIALRKSGQRLTGLCPFHEEKTPSFTVNPTRQRFHCFGCAADGDVFDFVRRIERVDFHVARRIVAAKVGVTVHDAEFTAEDAEAWAEERRAIDRDLPAARYWRRAALALCDELLDASDDSVIRSDDIAVLTRLGKRWRAIEGGELVGVYRQWKAYDPHFTTAMVKSAALYSTAQARALRRFIGTLDGEVSNFSG